MSDLEDILDGISSDSSSDAPPSESSDSHSQSQNSASRESNDSGPESNNSADSGQALNVSQQKQEDESSVPQSVAPAIEEETPNGLDFKAFIQPSQDDDQEVYADKLPVGVAAEQKDLSEPTTVIEDQVSDPTLSNKVQVLTEPAIDEQKSPSPDKFENEKLLEQDPLTKQVENSSAEITSGSSQAQTDDLKPRIETKLRQQSQSFLIDTSKPSQNELLSLAAATPPTETQKLARPPQVHQQKTEFAPEKPREQQAKQVSSKPEFSIVDSILSKVDEVTDKIIEGKIFDDKSEDSEIEQRPTRKNLRDFQAGLFQSFTAGASIAEKQNKFFSTQAPPKIEIALDERSKILQDVIEKSDSKSSETSSSGEESSSQDHSNSGSGEDDESDEQNQSEGSMMSGETDLLNRSLESDQVEKPTVVEAQNFLRYASEKVNQELDALSVVDKNERSFKRVAEQMIEQSSHLTQSSEGIAPKRLTEQRLYESIADRFHGDVGIAQGIPYCIAAIEDLIAIGCSDGSVRLFDDSEQELKVLSEKSLAKNAVTCIDIKRIVSTGNIYVVSGHNKGQLAIYEIKGLLTQQQLSEKQTTQQDFLTNIFGNVSFSHKKTLEDLHKGTVIQVKFAGDLLKDIQVISCDVTGIAQIVNFTSGMLGFNATKQLLMKTRMGAVYSMAPLLDYRQEFQSRNNPYQRQREEKNQLIAFGSLDEIFVTQFRPTTYPMLSLRRAPYIQPGTVPYLDWGGALTPTFRDKVYPVLAIAWGRTIQLAVYSNQDAVSKTLENPKLQLDGFYICESPSVDSVFFLSESILFVIVNKKEVRILYTQNFTPGVYDDSYVEKNLIHRKYGADSASEAEQQSIQNFQRLKDRYAGQVSCYAEKDCGYRIVDEEIRHKDSNTANTQRSKFNFNQTVCKNFAHNVIVLGKTQIGQRSLVHWQEYLNQVAASNDWLRVLRAALEIFSGKIIGLAGLPDQKEKRELLLREHMKQILISNISACIREFQEGECVSHKTLRVATEFCIRVGAPEFLFGKLFTMFAEGGVEQRYFENLDAFILSGKLKSVVVPPKLLQRILILYRQKDSELLEKAILNLSLKTYPHIDEVRLMCEELFLSSALIHLLTTQLGGGDSDQTACLQILCTLFNLMRKSTVKKTKKDVQSLLVYLENFGTSIFETANSDKQREDAGDKLSMFKKTRALKLDIERSSTYLGYKILWIMNLFLDGQRFPSGTLSEDLLQYYVMDIVRFCISDQFLQYFLEFDAEAFFQVIQKLFIQSGPATCIKTQDQFIAKKNDPNMEAVPEHAKILEIFHQKVSHVISTQLEKNKGKPTATSESVQNAFLFFMTRVSQHIRVEKPLSLRIVEQMIAYHRCLFSLDKKSLMELVPNTQLARKTRDRTSNIYTYLVKRSERELIRILVTHQSAWSRDEITNLLALIHSAPLFRLQIYLYQLVGEFQKCLGLFFSKVALKPDVFIWLNELQVAQHTLEDHSGFFGVKGVLSRITNEHMTGMVSGNTADFVKMNAAETVNLCDRWFDSDYMMVANNLASHKDLALKFLITVLEKHEPLIESEYNQFSQVSAKYQAVLLRIIEILTTYKRGSMSVQLVELVSRSYFPIEPCLSICQKEKHTQEACAVLYRRKGFYQKSVELYLQVLQTLCKQVLVHSMLIIKNIKFEDPKCTDKHYQQFDSLVKQIIKICFKNSQQKGPSEAEHLWMVAIVGLFEIGDTIYSNADSGLQGGEHSDSSEERDRKSERAAFDKFMMIRCQYFMSQMSEHLSLRRVIKSLEDKKHILLFEDLKKTFSDRLDTEQYVLQILETARIMMTKELGVLQTSVLEALSQGVQIQEQTCASCHQNFISKFDKQDTWALPCQHSYHARCINKTEGVCSICFNEADVICKLLTQINLSAEQFRSLRVEKKKRSGSNLSAREASSSDFTQSSRSTSLEEEEVFMRVKQQRELQLKDSIDKANRPAARRRFESKQDKQARLMSDFDKDASRLNMDLRNFKL